MTGGSGRRIATLGGLTAIGSLGIQMVVPALPQIAIDLSADTGSVALVVTVYLFGLAVAQLVHGPLVDAFGRRPVLIGGAIGFALASVAAWAAPGLGWLLVARLAQAVSAAATLVAARAMVADQGRDGASAMAFLMAIVMLSPVAAPVLGGGIALFFGWRAIFAALALAAVLGAFVAGRDLHETFDQRLVLALASVRAGWASVAGSLPFRRHAGVAAFTSAGLYSYMTLSPFLYTRHFGLPAAMLGLHYGTVAIGAATGAALTGYWLRRRPAGDVLRLGAAMLGLATIAVAAALCWSRAAWPLTGAMTGFAFATGIIGPSATIGAIAAPGVQRGTASSLYGAMQMSCGAIASLTAAALPHTPRQLALLLSVAVFAAMIFAWRLPGREVRS